MLRSFSYAAYAALNTFAQRRPDDAQKPRTLGSPSGRTPSPPSSSAPTSSPSTRPTHTSSRSPPQAQLLLNAYLLEKALYELLYELDNRPTWVRIPLAGILALPL